MVIWHCAEMVLHDYRYCIHEDMLGTYAHFAAPLPHQIRHCVKGARRLAPDWHEDLGAIGIAADQRPSWLPVMPPWEREASCCCERLRVKREGYLDLIHHVEVALLQGCNLMEKWEEGREGQPGLFLKCRRLTPGSAVTIPS